MLFRSAPSGLDCGGTGTTCTATFAVATYPLTVTKAGAGTQILSGSGNTYTGLTTVNAGILQAGANNGLLDLSLIQTDKYEEALRQGISKLWAGEDPKKILDKVAADWDAATQQVGLDKQKAVYESWAAKSGAYPK